MSIPLSHYHLITYNLTIIIIIIIIIIQVELNLIIIIIIIISLLSALCVVFKIIYPKQTMLLDI